VVNLSTVWVMASLNEKDFASVQVGSAASITTRLRGTRVECPRRLHRPASGSEYPDGAGANRSR
jgi:multidrug resistance efflux pump